MSRQGEVLPEMGSRGGFTRASLKVYDSNHLQFLAGSSLGYVFLGVGSTIFIEKVPQFYHLLGGVETAAAAGDEWLRPLSFKMKSLQIVRADPEKMGDLGHREVTQSLLCIWRKLLLPKLVEFPRNLCALHKNLVVEFERWKRQHALVPGRKIAPN